MENEKRGRGRPREYPEQTGRKGAPTITIRFSLDVYDWLKNRSEGARTYLERLVRNDRDGMRDQPVPLSDKQELASEA